MCVIVVCCVCWSFLRCVFVCWVGMIVCFIWRCVLLVCGMVLCVCCCVFGSICWVFYLSVLCSICVSVGWSFLSCLLICSIGFFIMRLVVSCFVWRVGLVMLLRISDCYFYIVCFGYYFGFGGCL